MAAKQELEIQFNPEISTWREDHKKVDAELEQSIKQDGLVTSMTARRLADGKLEMIGGHQRYKVLKKNGIPVTEDDIRIKENVSDVDAVLMAIAENAVRKSLTVIEEARAFRTLKRYGLTIDQIAEKVGLSKATVSGRLGALALPKHIQQKMQDGAIDFGYAAVLLKLKDYKEAQTSLANDIANASSYSGTRTIEQAEETVVRFFGELKHKEELVKKYGPCPKCGSKQISGSAYGNKDKLTCEICKEAWHKETKDPWEFYNLKQQAKELGLELEWNVEGKTAKLSPEEIRDILDKQTKDVEEEAKIQPTFRSKAAIADVAVALVKDNVMSLTVSGDNGDHIEIRLIEPSNLSFEAFKKDYQRTDDITKITVNGWNKNLAEMRPRVEEFLKSLIA